MDVTEDGIDSERNEEHPENALSPIDVTEYGIDKDSSDVQYEKALEPMAVTEDGIDTDCNRQPENAPAPMEVTLYLVELLNGMTVKVMPSEVHINLPYNMSGIAKLDTLM